MPPNESGQYTISLCLQRHVLLIPYGRNQTATSGFFEHQRLAFQLIRALDAIRGMFDGLEMSRKLLRCWTSMSILLGGRSFGVCAVLFSWGGPSGALEKRYSITNGNREV